jgi:hypothetical protein
MIERSTWDSAGGAGGVRRLGRLAREDPAHRLEVAHVRLDKEVPAVPFLLLGPVLPEHVRQAFQVAGVRQEVEVHDPHVWIGLEHPAYEVDTDEAGTPGHEYAARGGRRRHAPPHLS